MESPAQQILIEELVVEFPEIRQIEDRHLRVHDEILPHPFMREVRALVESAYRAAQPTERDLDLSRRIMKEIDGALSSFDPDVDNLVGVSFLEIPVPEESWWREMCADMGPHLRRMLAEKHPAPPATRWTRLLQWFGWGEESNQPG